MYTNAQCIDIDEAVQDINIDEALQDINDIIINAAEIAIPKSTNTVKKPPLPWFNQECKEAVEARNREERALKQ